MYRFQQGLFRRGAWQLSLLVGMLLIGGMVLAPVRPDAARAEDGLAKVYAVLRATPSVLVSPGDTLTYELEVRNVATSDAPEVQVILSYDPDHLELEGAAFELDRDFVGSTESDDVNRNQVTVIFKDLDDQTARTGTLTMRVNPALESGTVIETFASWFWIDAQGIRSRRDSNAAPVVAVAGTTVHVPYAWVVATPNVTTPETTIEFFSNRFLPEETVVFWLNAPGDVQLPLNRERPVDEKGTFRLELQPAEQGMAPGCYQLVAQGLNSGITGTADFEVLAPGAPATCGL